jgi:isopenicillin-N epimerase
MSELSRHWPLDPGIDFLNHGSFGACPSVVLEAQRQIVQRLEREPVSFMLRELEPALDSARAALAELVGADADDLAFVTNATTGVNTVLRSLSLSPGDELLTTDHVYNACHNALAFVAEQARAKLVVAKVPFPLTSPDEVVEAVMGAVTARTRLALLDHVTSPTGLIFPVETLVTELDRRGVDTLLDGAHAPGMVTLDLNALGAAYYTANCHKWLCAPKGAAFLHVRRDRQALVRPLVISHGATAPRPDRSRFRQELDWVGTDDPSAYLAVPDAIRFLRGLVPGGLPGLQQRNHSLAMEARDVLCRALGSEAPAPDSMLGAMATVPLPDELIPGISASGLEPLQELLFREHGIEVPVFTWPFMQRRWLRIAAQAYNELGQYERLAQVLTSLRRAPS